MTWSLLEQNKSGSVSIYRKHVWPFVQYKVLVKLRDSSEGAEFSHRFYSFKHHDKKASFLRFTHMKEFLDRAEKHHAVLLGNKELVEPRMGETQ